MRLYFAPGACSMSPHIVLRELGLQFEAVKVDLGTKRTADGKDFNAINPKGYVPALQLDDGRVLTEGPAIVQYLADRKPEAKLAPANGTLERYKLQEWLNFIATELHKPVGSLFNPSLPEEVRRSTKDRIAVRLKWLDAELSRRSFIMGEQFTVADAYLFTILSWADHVKVDVSPYAALKAFQGRVGSRPSVQEMLKAEGLMK